ncbi:MAG: preprotein translocase subunit SecG [Mariprofundaceae bacterium]
MTVLFVTLHIILGLSLIGVILIQKGQGADMGVSFGGGGAQTLFGSRGSGSFLGKLTGGLAAAFMITSLSLALFSQKNTGSIVESATQPAVPAQQEVPQSGAVGFDPSKLKQESGDPDLPPAQ